MNFIRNHNITVTNRAVIALRALAGIGIYGTITDLANEYGVSRPFVYTVKDLALKCFTPQKSNWQLEKEEQVRFGLKLIIALRLCGKCSIESISEILTLFQYPYHSIGYISEFLNLTSKKLTDNTFILEEEKTVIADEIFAGNNPILVIIDAHSHYLLDIKLAEDRTGETWNRCFTDLIEKGCKIKKIVKDLGTGMQKGIKGLEFIAQADLFHLLMRFDSVIGYFERAAFSAIENEEKSLKIYNNRKSKASTDKAFRRCIKAIESAENKIHQYDTYKYLHDEIHEAFNTFNKDGSFRSEEIIKGDVLAALALMKEEFPKHEKIISACDFLKKNIDEYFPYTSDVKNAIELYKAKLPDYQIKNICLAYQKYLKSYAVKDYHHSKNLRKEADELMYLSKTVCSSEDDIKAVDELFKQLNSCIRSSSPLEAKNSILRKYINSVSGQITQEYLNLVAVYLNRKTSIRGKYKGTSPIERETGLKEKENILELLMGLGNKTKLAKA